MEIISSPLYFYHKLKITGRGKWQPRLRSTAADKTQVRLLGQIKNLKCLFFVGRRRQFVSNTCNIKRKR